MNTQSARGRALAQRDEQIQSNIAKIEEAKARPTAIQAMASRLNLSPAKLQETLRNTVFRDANDREFAALIVVANEYRLNPLTKEIFAFKAKGGGIIPYVSVDGWIRIINEHPQFDGIEFDDIFDNGDFVAIECTIWRKDRSRPIKVVEYLDECQRETEPWRKSPKRFLRHRALMQCGRVAFGFSGISAEDDYEIIGYVQQDGGEVARQAPPPRRDQIAYEPVTGSDQEDEDAARALDAGFDPHTGEIISGNDHQEGQADEQRGERFNSDTEWQRAMAEINGAGTVIDVNARLNAVIGQFEGAEADDLRSAAMDRIADIKAKK
jgi:phage recombination protein Bet